MKFFSPLAILVQIAMLGSIVQAAIPTDVLVHFTTRELVEELQTRMDINARTVTHAEHAAAAKHDARSVFDDEFLEFSSRSPVGEELAGGEMEADPMAGADPSAGGGGGHGGGSGSGSHGGKKKGFKHYAKKAFKSLVKTH